MTVQSVKPTGNLRLDFSRSIIPPSALQALFLLQETVLRDSSGSLAAGAGGNSGIAATSPFAYDSPGLVLTFNGSQQERVVYSNFPGDTDFGKWCILGRFKPTAAPAATPGQIFGLGNNAGSQGGLGIGTDTSNNVGGTWLTGSGAGLGAKSAGSLNTWYTVYTQGGANNNINNAWINGAPATTQGVIVGGGISALTEVDFGAQHRSSGYLRNGKGNLEWGAVLYGITMTDGLAQALYAADWPYCMLVPAIRPRRTRLLARVSGGAAYNLTISAGTFALTGKAVAFRATKALPAAQGSITLTGRTVRLSRDYAALASQGSFGLTGETVILKPARALIAANGSFIFSGKAAALTRTATLTAAAGAFSLTGEAVGLRRGYYLPASVGSISLVGENVALRLDKVVAAAFGAFGLTGEAAGFGVTHVLAIAGGVFALSGQDVSLRRSGQQALTVGTGSIAVNGQSVELRAIRTMPAGRGLFALTGEGVGFAVTMPAGAGSFALSGKAAGLSRGFIVPAGLGSLVLTGEALTFIEHRALLAAYGGFLLTGRAVTLAYIQAGHGSHPRPPGLPVSLRPPGLPVSPRSARNHASARSRYWPVF